MSSSLISIEKQTRMNGRKRVAIVGSGCSGIAALWALKSTDHEIHLYESQDRLGGHTNTVSFKHGDQTTNVDTGFIVMNSATYRQSYGHGLSLVPDSQSQQISSPF